MHKISFTMLSIIIIMSLFNTITIYAQNVNKTKDINNTIQIDNTTKFCDSIPKNKEMFLSNTGWEYVAQKLIEDESAISEKGYAVLKNLYYNMSFDITDTSVLMVQEIFLRSVILIEMRNIVVCGTAFINWSKFPDRYADNIIISKVQQFYNLKTLVIDPQDVINNIRNKLNMSIIPYHLDILARQVYYKFYMKKYANPFYKDCIIDGE